MPTPCLQEVRRDVIAVAVARQGDQSVPQVARNFGISESCTGPLAPHRRPRRRPQHLALELAGCRWRLGGRNRELRPRTKQFEQENEILRRVTAYFARDACPK